MGFGRYFDEFEPGQRLPHWPGRTITETDTICFSLLTMNQHPLHIDSHYGSTTQHGRNLVVGTLVFSVAVGMSVADISGRAIANLEYEDIKHLGPVFNGDTIYAETQVLDVTPSKSKRDRGVVYVETRVLNQRSESVMTFRRRVLVPRRPAEAE